MNDSTPIPTAAIQRAIDECGCCLAPASVKSHAARKLSFGSQAILNHARMIAKYEPETLVDPLLIEAREIGATAITVTGYPEKGQQMRDGEQDRSAIVQAAYKALIRGGELERERGL